MSTPWALGALKHEIGLRNDTVAEEMMTVKVMERVTEGHRRSYK